MLPDPLAERLARSGVVAVVTVENPDDAGPIARALLAGGVGAIELTFRTARAAEAIRRMGESGKPALLLFPRYGLPRDVRPVPPSEVFVRLTQASTNYTMLGERGFEALTNLVQGIPACAIDYPDTETALALVDELWSGLA